MPDQQRIAERLLSTLTDRAGMMLSPDAVKKFGPDFGRNPVGTGPFQFVDWVKDDHLGLKRFDGYWDKAAGPYLDGVRYRLRITRRGRLILQK